MKKIIYFFAIITGSLLLNSCGDNDDDVSNSLGTISVGDETISLRTGIASYYGEYDEGSYNTDLSIISLSNSDVEALLKLDEDDSLTEEEYDELSAEILGDQVISGFYIEAFSDVIEKLSVGTYEGPSDTEEANTYTVAEFFQDDNYYELVGKLTVITSSKDYYNVEFLGETEDGTEVNFSFEGDFIYDDYSNEFSRSTKGVKSKKIFNVLSK